MESTAIPQRPIAALLDDPACAPLFSAKQAAEGTAVLVAGAPRTGKTSLAVAAAERGMDALGGERVVLAVPNRVLADEISPRLIRHAGVSVQARPATTLNALAFRLVTAQRARAGQPLPRLLNGAEQDALLRRTLGAHLAHVRAGDDCATCRLLRDYFANERWMRFVSDDFDGAAAEDASDGGAMTTEALLDAGINAAFTAQLRDMLARLDELGVGAEREDALIAAVADSGLEGDRLRIQWRLAFALRCEYIATISRAYPHEYRLDSSYLPVAAAAAVRALDGDDLPALVIVDDFQDTTLAGFALLETLRARGTRLLLTGNPDEAVQTFRGSYPETLFDRARTRLEARPLTLPAAAIPDDFLRTLASRVSLSIAATRADDTARPERPGKMPALPDAWPIRTMAAGDPRRADGTVAGQLYRSAGEELENVLWQVKTAHLQRGVAWNDMGVILHDNAQVRRFGERLRDGGVPVRYSSVTRPLAEEPFVQALFALIELAQLRNDGLERRSMTLAQAAAFVRSRVRMVVASPLLEEARGTELPHPMAMEPIDAAMRSLQSLATIGARPAQAAADGTGDDADTADSAAPSDSAQAADREAAPDTALAELAAQWERLRERVADAHEAARDQRGVDVEGQAEEDELAFGVDALYLMLAEDGAPLVTETVERICGTDRDDGPRAWRNANAPARRFAHLWAVVADIAKRLKALRDDAPQFALEAAWMACDVASRWQRDALFNTAAGRAANDRLDTAMRLFEYARGEGVAPTIGAFIDQVRALSIQADSLARLAPVDDAVTLTTPAGAAGHRFAHVWLPGLQEGTWPNLAARNTMFGGEDLVDVQLFGALEREVAIATGQRDPALEEVLATEQKSFLVAVTRADATLTLSATLNDDAVPSDFLYIYLPELFDRDRDADPATRVYAELGTTGLPGDTARPDTAGEGDGGDAAERFGMDADARGLIALARIALATGEPGSPEVRDAEATLTMLARAGFADADPRHWAFLTPVTGGRARTSAARAGDGTAESSSAASGAPTAAAASSSASAAHHHATRTVERDLTPPHADPYGQAPVVTLSPSKVDRLWDCPVCARMEQQFFGPTPTSVALNFGSIIHDVAAIATQEGWDRPDFKADIAPDARIEAITDLMYKQYETMRDDPEQFEKPEERYDAIRRDEEARATLGNIAAYFVDSNIPERYPLGRTAEYEVGRLTDARAEVEFTARFDLSDIAAAYNAMPGVAPADTQDLMGIMGALVDGWPSTMRPDLAIRLTGRMDRLEERARADGTPVTRLIDYKTVSHGHSGPAHFNDLQLVCYQLGLAFPEDGGRRGADALAAMPTIAQSDLFDVRVAARPATKGGAAAEPYFQEPLFRDGALNDGPFTRRTGVRTADKLADLHLPAEPPEDVSREAWEGFLNLRGTMAPWALAMVARVFYTAAASLAERLDAHPTPAHEKSCRLKQLCPACAGRASTVFESKEG